MTKTSYVVMAVGENRFIENIIANSITAPFNVRFVNLIIKIKIKGKGKEKKKKKNSHEQITNSFLGLV